MLSRETLEAYRRITANQRLALTAQMIRENTLAGLDRLENACRDW